MYNRAVLHLDLDAFFVSVECVEDSRLIGKPLIIGGTSSRGVVSCCSYEARRYGVRSAMPIKMALRLCPDAIVRRGDGERYSYYSKLVTDIVAEDAPVYEKASIDEFYVDLTGMDRYFGCFQWSSELRNRITAHSGLPISFGLSVNKLVSKVGTNEAKPNGTRLVEAGTEKAFFDPLSTHKLPSVGKATYRKLSFMGVRTIRTLSELPVELLQREFGKPGISLWKKANAIDHSPVIPYDEQKSISTEMTFQTDTIEVRWIRDQLSKMASKLAFDLRQLPKLCSCITVKIRYSDFNTFTKQKRIPYTANDATLIRLAHELFDSLYERRQLIRLVGVRLSGLVHGNFQLDLFDTSSEEVNLLRQLDRIRKRFGPNAIMRASALGLSRTHTKPIS